MSQEVGQALLRASPRLQKLELQSLTWSSLSPAFEQLGQLTSVNLFSLTKLSQVPYVMSKDLSFLQIYGLYSAKDLADNQFSGNTELTVLILNSLRSAPSSIGSLQKLTSLTLEIGEGGSLQPIIFESCASLQRLTLFGRGISAIPSSISNCKKLFFIDMFGVDLSGPQALPDLSTTSVDYLSIKLSQLREIPETLCNCKRLSTLNIDTSLVASLPACLGTLPSLEDLRIFDSKLTVFPSDIVEGLAPTISSLALGENSISQFPPNALLQKLKNLRSLSFKGNVFTNKQLPDDAFTGSPLIWFDSLDITDCGFIGPFPSNATLIAPAQYILADNNQFTSLPDDIISMRKARSSNLSFRNNALQGAVASLFNVPRSPSNTFLTVRLDNNQLNLCPPPSSVPFKDDCDLSMNNLCDATPACLQFWASTQCKITPALPCS